MKFKSILALILISLFFTSTCFSAPETSDMDTAKKPTLMILPILDNSGFKKSEDIITMTKEALNKKFTSPKYNILSEQTVIDSLKKSGINDLNAVERSDLISLGKDNNVDYVILIELAPVTVVQTMSLFSQQYEATVSLKVKIVDVKQSKYFFTNTFTEKNKNQAVLIGGVGSVAPVKNALKQALEKFDTIAEPQ